MIDNIVTNITYCKSVVDAVSGAVFYSHIPTALVMLVVALLIHMKNRKLILAQILLYIAICFSIWTALDLSIWVYYSNSTIVMFSWSIIEMFSLLLFILSLYFMYIYIYKNDVSFYIKIGVVALFVPIVILSSTTFNLTGFNAQECIATEGQALANYVFGLKVFMSLLMLGLVVRAFIKSDTVSRKKILVLAVGMLSFVFAFLLSGIIASFTENYTLEIYGLLAIGIFIVALARLVVAYGEFNMKVFTAQILVMGLVAIVAAQFAFIQNPVNELLNGLTTLLSVIFGWILIRSVKREIEQKQQITKMAEDVRRAYAIEKKANTELEQLDKVKDQFLMTTQHNLRTPLTSIMGYSDLILNGTYGKQNKKTVEVIQKFQMLGKGMIKMVNDFLDASAFQLGKDVVSLKPDVELLPLVEEVVNELKFKAEDKKITLTLEKPQQVFKIKADPQKLKAAIFNVIDNSIKYTMKGGVDVKFKNHDSVKIVVSDTGIGIAQDHLKNLFTKMFERGTNAKNITGSGVGLYLSYQIIKSHNGKLWAESEGEGKGSQFYIELPLG